MDEGRRKSALDRYAILDTKAEPVFDAITDVVARTLDVPIALVSFVDSERQWFKSCRGLGVRETPRGIAFCAHAIESDDTFVIPDAQTDDRFSSNPLVVGSPFIRSYAGAPLVAPDGARLGTLCAIDRRPRTHGANDLATLRDLARVVVQLLEDRLSARERHILARVSEVSPNGAFVYDLRSRKVIWHSPGLAGLLGMAPERWRDAIHPDDVARIDTFDFETDAGAPIETVPFRVPGRDGRPDRALISRRTVFERDEDGAARTVVGIVTDITALRLADARLRASERALADRVLVLEGILESADEGIM